MFRILFLLWGLTMRGRVVPIVPPSAGRNRSLVAEEEESFALWIVREHTNDSLLVLDANYSVVYSAEPTRVEHAPYLPEYKYHPQIEFSPGDTLIARAWRTPRLANFTLKPRRNGKRWEITGDSLTAIAESNDVLWIDEMPKIKMLSSESRRLLMGSLDSSYDGSGITVTITDTGLDDRHCMFYDPLHPDPVHAGYDVSTLPPTSHSKIRAVLNIPGYTDFAAVDGAHGTSTAGVAVGNICLDETGVAPSSKLLFVDIAPQGTDDKLILPADMTFLFSQTVAFGATAHGASWGSIYADGDYDDLASQFDEAARDHPKLVHVCAAGNDGPTGLVSSPCTCKNCLSVGAGFSRPEAYPSYTTNVHPEYYTYDSVASFSSVGPTVDGRRAPILYAPGVAVVAAYAFAAPDPDHTDTDVVYGTSFSAPAILGLVAAFQSYYSSLTGVVPDSSLTRAVLIAFASPPKRVVTYLPPSVSLVSSVPPSGYGTPVSVNFSAASYAHSESIDKTVTRWSAKFVADKSSTRKIALSWTDVAGTPGTSKALVNDLDLYVLKDGKTRVGSAPDDLNPNELVKFDAVAGTLYRVVVIGYLVGTQTFSLAFLPSAQTTSSGTCLPYDYEICETASGTGSIGCDPATGEFDGVCRYKTCASGYGGDACATATNGTSCSVSHGTGTKNANGTCVVVSCDEGYFVSSTGCVCESGTDALVCADGLSWTTCDSTGNYPACSNGGSSKADPVASVSSPSSSSASLAKISFWVFSSYIYAVARST